MSGWDYDLASVANSGPTIGWLLRSWRSDVAHLSASGVAAELGVARSAVANWEADRRRPSKTDLTALDTLYRAGGALVRLCESTATPTAFDADSTWWHHFSRSSGPCWAWVRVERPSGRVRIQARWGPLRIEVERRCGPEGVIITLPVSTPEPPVCVTIDPPGWVDFGSERIPSALPVPSSSVVTEIRPVWPLEPAVALFAKPLRPLLELRGGWVDDLKQALGLAGGASDSTNDSRIEDLTIHPPYNSPDPSSQWPGPRYRALREARAMSRSEVAKSVSALAEDEPLGAGQLEVLEQGGHPRVHHLAARLDVTYHAGGRTLVSTVEVTQRGAEAVLHLPVWWHGPLWVQPITPDRREEAGVIGIRWGPWKKWVRLRPSAVVSTRKNGGDPTGPTVMLPESWRLRAGIGQHPAACPIDYGWWPATTDDAAEILKRHAPAYLGLFNGKAEDLRSGRTGRPISPRGDQQT